MTVTEIANETSLPIPTVRKWCSSGKLKATRRGRRWNVRTEDLYAASSPFWDRAFRDAYLTVALVKVAFGR